MGITQTRLYRHLFVTVFVSLITLSSAWGLAPEFMRNGEIYLLIGDGPYIGVYRLNDPSSEGIYLGWLYDPTTSIGIAVDLSRNVYTISEKIKPGYNFLDISIPRQVVDDSIFPGNLSKSQLCSDYGWHAYIHYDHRGTDAKKPVYRTGPVGRAIRSNSGGTWAGFRSAGPGTPISAPAGNPLPVIDGKQDVVEAGKQWYAIPNGKWYSSWDKRNSQKTTYGPYPGKFFPVFRDTVNGQAHNWRLHRWNELQHGIGGSYIDDGLAGTTYDYTYSRWIFAGCLDGCGGATGTGTGQAKPMHTCTAFQPPMGGGTSRAYIYSREDESSLYSLTVKKGTGSPVNYVPPAGNPIIGNPSDIGIPPDQGTRWIGVSLRDATSDYVYAMSTSVLANWYEEAASTPPYLGFSIDAVSVSNQWDQIGGIVYAYDKYFGEVFLFKREDKTTRTIKEYDNFTVGNNVDDIAADGFGNFFFARTTKDPTGNAQTRFEANPGPYTIDVVLDDPEPDADPADPKTGKAYYAQEFAKNVFMREISTGNIKSEGMQPLGYVYYARSFTYPSSATVSLKPYASFHTRLAAAGGYWGDGTPGSGWLVSGAPRYENTYNPVTAPKHIELAVINVPTPPIPYGATSTLDIVGPFANYPIPSTTSTHQSGWLSHPNPRVPYFYMVENYPLFRGIDPNSQPDWNSNGFLGGFISTTEAATYTWKLWQVAEPAPGGKERYLSPKLYSPAIQTGEDPYFVFYSNGGRYVLTLESKFNWWDYHKLPADGMALDVHSPTGRYRDLVYMKNVDAMAQNRDQIVSNINTAFASSDIFASFTADLAVDAIIPLGSKTMAAIPISVAGDPPPPVLTAIERCDNYASATAQQIWSENADNYTNFGYHHGIYANATSAYRIKNIQHLLSPIEGNSYVKGRILNPADVLYVKGNPSLEFRDESGDLEWAPWTEIGTVIQGVKLDGLLSAQLPNGPKFEQRLFDNIIATSTSESMAPISIPFPSDPTFYKMNIKAQRMFRYRAYPKTTKVVNGTEIIIYGTPLWIPSVIDLEAEAVILALDNKKPSLNQALTSPRNLFGFTGQPMISGIGPSGMENPRSVNFRFDDNNPWENGPNAGLASETSSNNLAWNSDPDNFSGMDSRQNLKPVFCKEHRLISVTYEFAQMPPAAPYEVTISQQKIDLQSNPPQSFNASNSPGLNGEIESHLGFDIPLDVFYQSTISRMNANNTPNYEPYGFSVSITDSSGNSDSTALNLVLNVRDNIPPIPWLKMTNMKTSAIKTVPAIENRTRESYYLLPTEITDNSIGNGAPTDIVWDPTSTGNIAGIAVGPAMKALPQKHEEIVKNVKDNDSDEYANILACLEAGVPPDFLEDNVEFTLIPFASDNGGTAYASASVKYIDATGNTAIWDSSIESTLRGNPPSEGDPILGFFRGWQGDFPMLCPIEVTARDDAKDWNYYVTPGGSTNWEWPETGATGAPVLNDTNPPETPNTRTLRTVIPVFDSRMKIRILDKRQERD